MPFERPRRSSILKPPKARNPLSDLNLNPNDGDEDGTTQFIERNKRVSFSNTQGIALFRMAEHGNTIWDNFYEEPNKINFSETTELDIEIPEENDKQSNQTVDLDDIKEQLLNNDSDSFDKLMDITLTPTEGHNITFANNKNDNDDDDEDICVNISTFNSRPMPPRRITDIMLELTNPSVNDQTEALINYKIQNELSTYVENDKSKNASENIEKKDVIEEANKICSPAEFVPSPNLSISSSSKPKSTFVHSFIYSAKNTENWQEDKENKILLDDTLEVEPENKPSCDINARKNVERDSDCRMSLTPVISEPHAIEIVNNSNPKQSEDVLNAEKPLIKLCDESSRRRTVVFDQQDSNCNMSMTTAISSTLVYQDTDGLIMNVKQSKSSIIDRAQLGKSFEVKNKRQTFLFNNEDPNMSMSTAVSSTMICDDDKGINLNNTKRKRQTIVFDQNGPDCNMSITKVISSSMCTDNDNSIMNKRRAVVDPLIDAQYNPFKNDQSNKRQTIVFDENNPGFDMSITSAISSTIVSNDPDERQSILSRGILKDEINPVNRLSTIDESNPDRTSQSDRVVENSRRQTIVFDQNNVNCEMSMTTAIPSSVPTNQDNDISLDLKAFLRDACKDNSNKSIIDAERQNCDMSMTNVMPARNKSGLENLAMVSDKENRRQTVVFDQKNPDCEMSMTAVIPASDSPIVTYNQENGRRQTIIFDQKNADCEMSMTTIIPTTTDLPSDSHVTDNIGSNDVDCMRNFNCETSITNAIPSSTKQHNISIDFESILRDVYNDKPNRQTVAFDQKRPNLDLPSRGNNISLDSEAISNKDKCIRQTIIFDQKNIDCEMSMTSVIPTSASLNREDCRRQTIVFDQKQPDCEMSITTALPSLISQADVNIERRQTIIFDKNSSNCDMSMTTAIPPNNFHSKTLLSELNDENQRRKTIIFDQMNRDCEMSMTTAIPSTDIKCSDNEIDVKQLLETDQNNSQRKTIIFDQKNPIAEMSITSVINAHDVVFDQESINNEMLECNDAITNFQIYENNTDMDIDAKQDSKCEILTTYSSSSNTLSSELDINICKAKTIIYDPNDCEMSMTTAIPSSKINDKENNCSIPLEPSSDESNKADFKRQSIAFQLKHADCDESTATPSDKFRNFNLSTQESNKYESKKNYEVSMSTSDISMSDFHNISLDVENLLKNPVKANQQRQIIVKDASNCGIMSALSSHDLNKENCVFNQIKRDVPLNTDIDKENCKNQNEMPIKNILPQIRKNNTRFSIDTLLAELNKDDSIIVDEELVDMDVSVTSDVQCKNTDVKHSLTQSHEDNLCKRQTIVFDQRNSDCEMSMTTAIPSVGSPNVSINNFASEINIEKLNQTPIVDQKDTNVSLTEAILSSDAQDIRNTESTAMICSNIQDNNENISLNIDAEESDKENLHCDMSTTTIPCIQNDSIKDRRQTIVFDQMKSDCEMSMTTAIPSAETQDMSINNLASEINNEILNQTPIIDQKDTNVSRTETMLTSDAQEIKNTESTAIICPNLQDNDGNISLNIDAEESDKDNLHCDISTTTIPCIQNDSIKDKRQTIVFDQMKPDCEMSMTMAILSLAAQDNDMSFEENKMKAVVQSHADYDMSMTNAMPCLVSQGNENSTMNTYKLLEGLNDEKHGNQSVFFDQKHVICEMSMVTATIPSSHTQCMDMSITMNTDRLLNELNEEDLRNQSEFSDQKSDNCEMLMSTSIPCLISDNTNVSITKSAEQSNQSLAFDQKNIDREMSMTTAISSLNSHDISVNNIDKSKVKLNGDNDSRAIVDQKNLNCEISPMTPSSDSPVEEINVAVDSIIRSNTEDCLQQKIVCDQERPNIEVSLSEAIPSLDVENKVNISLIQNNDNNIGSDCKILPNIDSSSNLNGLNNNSSYEGLSSVVSPVHDPSYSNEEKQNHDDCTNIENHHGNENNIEIKSNTLIPRVSLNIDQCEAMDVDEYYSFAEPPILAQSINEEIPATSEVVECEKSKTLNLSNDESKERLQENASNASKCDDTFELLMIQQNLPKISEQIIPTPSNSRVVTDTAFLPKGDSIDTSSVRISEEKQSECDNNVSNRFVKTDDSVSAEHNEVVTSVISKSVSIEKMDVSEIINPIQCDENDKLCPDDKAIDAVQEISIKITPDEKSTSAINIITDCTNTTLQNNSKSDSTLKENELSNVSIRSNSSNKINYSSLDPAGDSDDNYIAAKRRKSSTSVCAWLQDIRQSNEPLEISLADSDSNSQNNTGNDTMSGKNSGISKCSPKAKVTMLENISDVSLVDTSLDTSENACDISNLQNDKIEEINLNTIDINEIVQTLNFKKCDCVMENNANGNWTFLLLRNTIRLRVMFDSDTEKNPDINTNISKIAFECIYDADLKSIPYLMCKAMKNQLNTEAVASSYSALANISDLLNHCVDIAQKTQRWGRLIHFLYLQNSFQWDEERFTYHVRNTPSLCIWEFEMSLSNVPYAKPEDVKIRMKFGKSPIPYEELMKVIEKIEPSWDYMKHFVDDLYDYVQIKFYKPNAEIV